MAHFADCRVIECLCDLRRYKQILWILIGILVIEGVGMSLSQSLMLSGDMIHVLIDTIPIVIALLIAGLMRKKRFETAQRFDRMGGFISGSLLVGMSILIGIKAYGRIKNPEEIAGLPLLVASIAGAIGNAWQHKIARDFVNHSHSHKGMMLHILSDFWQSITIIIGAIVVLLTGWTLIDTILSGVIALSFCIYGAHLMYQTYSNQPHS